MQHAGAVVRALGKADDGAIDGVARLHFEPTAFIATGDDTFTALGIDPFLEGLQHAFGTAGGDRLHRRDAVAALEEGLNFLPRAGEGSGDLVAIELDQIEDSKGELRDLGRARGLASDARDIVHASAFAIGVAHVQLTGDDGVFDAAFFQKGRGFIEQRQSHAHGAAGDRVEHRHCRDRQHPDEQRQRFTQAMDEKERRYGERYPLDEDFLAAMAHMPDACGVALGFDRLVMLASGAARVDQVVWTPTGSDA